MAEFVYAKHKGVDGLAYLSKDALDQFPGWTEATKADIEAERKTSTRAVKTTD
jgi:hypothetical protein